MRMLKAPGGLAHGPGITDSTQTKWVHVMPRCILICSYLESFCGVHTQTSDQHNDLLASSTSQDVKDYTSLLGWLQEQSPLLYTAHDALVSVSTGGVADKSVNADKAYSIGLAANENISVQGHNVEVKSELLFLRVTCVIKDQHEIKEHLKHGFGNKPPPSLIKMSCAKTERAHVLADVLKSNVTPLFVPLQNLYYVIDGGQLLYRIKWSTCYTYDQV